MIADAKNLKSSMFDSRCCDFWILKNNARAFIKTCSKYQSFWISSLWIHKKYVSELEFLGFYIFRIKQISWHYSLMDRCNKILDANNLKLWKSDARSCYSKYFNTILDTSVNTLVLDIRACAYVNKRHLRKIFRYSCVPHSKTHN